MTFLIVCSTTTTREVCKPSTEVSPQTSTPHTFISSLSQRTNGDAALSADPPIGADTVTTPPPIGNGPSSGECRHFEDESPFDLWEPIRTYNGIKWVPTIAHKRIRTCPGCSVYDECAADVADGDFAWCEQVIPADYQLTNPKRTAYQL